MKKENLLIIIFVITSFSFIKAQDIFISNTSNRTFTSLNGKWEYVLDPYKTWGMGGRAIYENAIPQNKTDRVEYSFNSAQTIWVPGSWNTQKPELSYFEGIIWYRRMFDKKDISRDKRYFIHVGAANYISHFTFNGKRLGIHEGGYTPYNFEVTDLIKESGNFLIIGVDASRKTDNIPAEVFDWFNHGGITRDVKLIEVPQTFINNYFISLDNSTLNSRTKRIKGKVYLAGKKIPEKIRLIIPELNFYKEFSADSNSETSFTFDVSNLDLWSPENPRLYKVTIEAGNDLISDLIGFRTIATKGKQILLNGKPIFLKGICLHDENPFRKDRAINIEDAKLLLDWAQELGCNFIRLAHYPHQENLVRLADKRGVLLWEELPLYWGINWNNPEVLKKAKKHFLELINRDFNRASSIIWSIANETAVIPERNEFLSELTDYIRSFDDTRLISAACKKDQNADGHPDDIYTFNDPIMEKLDIISFNEYLGWYGGLPDECRSKTFQFGIEKPVIVSEFGGGAIEGFFADSLTRWSEDFQEYHFKESIAMFDKIDGLAGMTPWILVDFMSPMRQLHGVQDGWNRKGLISEKGHKKKAFYILQNYYKSK